MWLFLNIWTIFNPRRNCKRPGGCWIYLQARLKGKWKQPPPPFGLTPKNNSRCSSAAGTGWGCRIFCPVVTINAEPSISSGCPKRATLPFYAWPHFHPRTILDQISISKLVNNKIRPVEAGWHELCPSAEWRCLISTSGVSQLIELAATSEPKQLSWGPSTTWKEAVAMLVVVVEAHCLHCIKHS